ncbi:MAG: class I SAM-dependent methyltransferase [Defluviitaleaceae bacterium]|nr:class I SAM-dependent methyltransferase [Defluviitaleaceae bacterium]
MKVEEKNIIAYDKKADNYDKTLDGKFTEKFKSLLLSTMELKNGDSVLDVACGNGTLLSKMARLKEIQGFGADISPKMIENATILNPDFQFVVAGYENMPFDDNSVDIITVCAAYHHFSNVEIFATEVKRLLKPTGNLYIAEIYLPTILRNIANVFLPFSKDGDVKFYSTREIENTFSKMGFHLVNKVVRGHIQIVRLQKNKI